MESIFKLLEIISICSTTMKFVLTGRVGAEYTVDICSEPTCSCSMQGYYLGNNERA